MVTLAKAIFRTKFGHHPLPLLSLWATTVPCGQAWGLNRALGCFRTGARHKVGIGLSLARQPPNGQVPYA